MILAFLIFTSSQFYGHLRTKRVECRCGESCGNPTAWVILFHNVCKQLTDEENKKMEILKFEGSSRAPLKQRKGFRVILGITVMGVFAALGSTLAANITINTSNAVEFGQGLSAASACDSSISVKPVASFSNQSETAGVFMLSGITFSDIDTGTSACAGKQLVI
ncbi:MAG: hypothetical protein ACO4AM_02790, partial [Candidatus Nanopelagicaceae bacterium]